MAATGALGGCSADCWGSADCPCTVGCLCAVVGCLASAGFSLVAGLLLLRPLNGAGPAFQAVRQAAHVLHHVQHILIFDMDSLRFYRCNDGVTILGWLQKSVFE